LQPQDADGMGMHEPVKNYREEEIVKISGDEALKFGTPQRLARDWIMLYDDAKLDADDPRLVPRYIMAVIYYSLKGNLWGKVEGWLGEEDICFWRGVCCLDPDFKHCTTGPDGASGPRRIELKLGKGASSRSCCTGLSCRLSHFLTIAKSDMFDLLSSLR
jgi:hypothetical protein